MSVPATIERTGRTRTTTASTGLATIVANLTGWAAQRSIPILPVSLGSDQR